MRKKLTELTFTSLEKSCLRFQERTSSRGFPVITYVCVHVYMICDHWSMCFTCTFSCHPESENTVVFGFFPQPHRLISYRYQHYFLLSVFIIPDFQNRTHTVHFLLMVKRQIQFLPCLSESHGQKVPGRKVFLTL